MNDTRLCRGGCLLVAAALLGCGAEKTKPTSSQEPAKTAAVAATSKTPVAPTTSPAKSVQKTDDLPRKTEAPPASKKERPTKRFPTGSAGRTFADEMQALEAEEQAQRQKRPQLARPRLLDDDRLRAGGLRKLTGKHLTLYTDLPSKPAIDELPRVFDQAFPQWCEFFRVEKDQSPTWHMRGFLISEKGRGKFQDLDVIPPDVPEFLAGYTLRYEFFMFEQQSDYYRRHLMLHEGTHGFMMTMLGLCTSPWYAEGTAELLGSHLWESGKLTLRQFPRSREETAYHGRIKLVKECFSQRRAATLDEIVARPFDLHAGATPAKERQEGYAWCWASSAFLDGHSRYAERFRLLCSKMRTLGEVPGTFRQWYEADWEDLMEEWQVFVSGLEYGYDLDRNKIAFARGVPLAENGTTVTVNADQGWQSARVALEPGKEYDLSGTGRVVLAEKPGVLASEADGITIRYHYGLPLGALVAAVRIEKEERDRLMALAHQEQPKLGEEELAAIHVSAFLRPIVVGRATKITPRFPGTLYLKVNDSPAELADNKGKYQVRIARSSR